MRSHQARYNNESVLRGLDLNDAKSMRVFMTAFDIYMNSTFLEVCTNSSSVVSLNLTEGQSAVLGRITRAILANSNKFPLLLLAMQDFVKNAEGSIKEVKAAIRRLEDLAEEHVLMAPVGREPEYLTAVRKFELFRANGSPVSSVRGSDDEGSGKKETIDSEDEDEDDVEVEVEEGNSRTRSKKMKERTPLPYTSPYPSQSTEANAGGEPISGSARKRTRSQAVNYKLDDSTDAEPITPPPQKKRRIRAQKPPTPRSLGPKQNACLACKQKHVTCDKDTKHKQCGNCRRAGRECIRQYRGLKSEDEDEDVIEHVVGAAWQEPDVVDFDR